jgi:hypothetical protein
MRFPSPILVLKTAQFLRVFRCEFAESYQVEQ